MGNGSRGARGHVPPPEQVCWGAQGGTVLWQDSDLLMSHVVKFDGSVALVYALHDLPFDFSLLQLKKNLVNKHYSTASSRRWVWFYKNWTLSKNFCAHCMHNHVKCPPNCQHLPAPMNNIV